MIHPVHKAPIAITSDGDVIAHLHHVHGEEDVGHILRETRLCTRHDLLSALRRWCQHAAVANKRNPPRRNERGEASHEL